MNRTDHVRQMAAYNEWMNAKLYEAAARLPEGELGADRKGPFRSLLGIFNHLVVADTLWLKRFVHHPAHYAALEPIRGLPVPVSLDQILFADLPALTQHRQMLDRVIIAWTDSVADADLDHVLNYTSIKGLHARKDFFGVLMHFFNHQTHHRGQATTLLWQAGIDVGVTDLLALIPNQETA